MAGEGLVDVTRAFSGEAPMTAGPGPGPGRPGTPQHDIGKNGGVSKDIILDMVSSGEGSRWKAGAAPQL